MCAVQAPGVVPGELPAAHQPPAARLHSTEESPEGSGTTVQVIASCKGSQQELAASIPVISPPAAAPAPSRCAHHGGGDDDDDDDAAAACSGGNVSSPLSAGTPRAFACCKVSSPQPCSKVAVAEERASGMACRSTLPVRVSLPPKAPRHPTAAVGISMNKGGSLKVAHASEAPTPQPVTPSYASAAATAQHAPPGTATHPSLDIPLLASAVAASKLGLVDQLSSALVSSSAVAVARDAEERTCLHYAAGYGHEECVGLLLDAGSDTRVRDINGDVPLHFAAIHGHPMCAYNIAKICPATCVMRNERGQTPVCVAVACERGEVLNAMLLACAGDGTAGVAVQAMRRLLASGAVPDTWAPNGSSALMLAAAANGTDALKVLLEAGATLELQDALGRSALMFAAGNTAADSLLALLDAGACIAQRDRRGRNVLDYAPEGSDVRRLLQGRLNELEAVAAKRQEDLLASLLEEDCCGDASKAAASSKAAKKKASKKAAKAVSKAKVVPGRADNLPAAAAAASAAPSGDSCLARALACPVTCTSAITGDAAAAAAAAISTPAVPVAEPAVSAAPDAGANAWQTVCKPSAKRQHGDGEVPFAPTVAASAMPPRPSRGVQAPVPKAGPARAAGASTAATPTAAKMGSRTGSSNSLTAHVHAATLDAMRLTRSSMSGQSASSSYDSMPPASSPVAQSLLIAARSKAVKSYQAPQHPASGFKAALMGAEAAAAEPPVPATPPAVSNVNATVAAPSIPVLTVAAPVPGAALKKAPWASSAASSSVLSHQQAMQQLPAPAGHAVGEVDAVIGLSPRSFPPLSASAVVGSSAIPVTTGSSADGGDTACAPCASNASVSSRTSAGACSGVTTAGSAGAAAMSSSPMSFGCDWSRPSPVDMWQAAFATSAGAPGSQRNLSASSSTSQLNGGGSLDGSQLGREVRPSLLSGPLAFSATSSSSPGSAIAAAAGPKAGSTKLPNKAPAAPEEPKQGGMETAKLRAENETLKRQLHQAQQHHCHELAEVLQDAAQHEVEAVEAALAQERLRITTNLLAIGLCPQAILAVISPPGHALSLGSDLSSSLATGTVGMTSHVPGSEVDAEVCLGAAAPVTTSTTSNLARSDAVPMPPIRRHGSKGGSEYGAGSGLLAGSFSTGIAGGGGSLCGGLGLAAMAPVVDPASNVESEDADDGWGMDLPACGDISALLAMSDDDDA